MQHDKAIYECNCETPIPEGNYKGLWNENVISFQVIIEGASQPCQINATETKSNLAVMVVVLVPYIYIHDQSKLK